MATQAPSPLTKAWVKEQFMVAANIALDKSVVDPRGAEYTMCDYIVCEIHFTTQVGLKDKFEAKNHYFLTAADAADPFLSQMKMSLDDVLNLLKSYDIQVIEENGIESLDMSKLAKLRGDIANLAANGPMPIRTIESILMTKLGMSFNVAEEAAKKYDTSGDGKISAMELLAGLEGEAQASKVKEIFTKWDRNKDGLVDFDELHAMLVTVNSAQGKTWARPDTFDLLSPCDRNGDGKISLAEFINVVFEVKK